LKEIAREVIEVIADAENICVGGEKSSMAEERWLKKMLSASEAIETKRQVVMFRLNRIFFRKQKDNDLRLAIEKPTYRLDILALRRRLPRSWARHCASLSSIVVSTLMH
jgi:hypothetical protein